MAGQPTCRHGFFCHPAQSIGLFNRFYSPSPALSFPWRRRSIARGEREHAREVNDFTILQLDYYNYSKKKMYL